MNTEFYLVHNNIVKNFSSLEFKKNCELENNTSTLFCGKFIPPIAFNGTAVEYINFTDFSYFRSSFVFCLSKKVILTQEYISNQKFEIIDPSKLFSFFNSVFIVF